MTIAGSLRLAARLLALTVLAAGCVPLHYMSAALTRRSRWPRRFLRWAGWVVGARVRVEGTALARDAVLLPNHLSALDIPVLAGATGCVFVAKGELEHAAVVGWLSSLNDTVFIARADRLGVARQIEQVRGALARRRPLVIFAEGGTGDGLAIKPFKPALLAAIDPPPPGLRVQPVLVDYGPATAELAWADGEPGLSYARRLLARAGTLPVTLRMLAPFDPAALAGRKAVAAEGHTRVSAAFAAARAA